MSQDVTSERYVQEKIAAFLVIRLLKEAGHEVESFSVESVGEYLDRRQENPTDMTYRQLKYAPDLIVRLKSADHKSTAFIDVRYSQTLKHTYENDAKSRIQKQYWPGTRVLVVCPNAERVFWIEHKRHLSAQAFEAEFEIPGELTAKYESIARILLGETP
jgi:hypothetical protein